MRSEEEPSQGASLNKAQKLVRLLEWMQRPGGVRAHEVLARLEVEPRSLRRYLADLRALGIPLEERGRGEHRVLSVDPSYRRSHLELTLGELLSLRLGRTLFAFLEGTGFAEDLSQAIDRLEPTLSRANAEVVRDFDRMFLAVPEPSKDYSERDSADLVDEILTALLRRNVAEAVYRRPSGEPRSYRLEPLTLAVYRQGLYLFARDVAEDRVKTFAVERFRSFRRLRREHFERPPDWDPRAYLGDAFGITRGPPESVRLLFSAEAAEFVRERRWHRSQELVELPDGRLELRLRCALTPELHQWVLGFGEHVEVLEPPALLEAVRDALARALAHYGESP